MPGHIPTLDRDALQRLRELVRQMHESNGNSVPMQPLVELARDVNLDGGVTIDFEASHQLGSPMVVLRVPQPAAPDARLGCLSSREMEVAQLVTGGLSNKQIADKLFISIATVKDHVHRILEKTGLNNRAAVAAAYRGGNGSAPTSISRKGDK